MDMNNQGTHLPTRQVHLDFHTSPFISGIAGGFSPGEFAEIFQGANVESVTVFARCVHGYLYYASGLFREMIHPHLENLNLLTEQVEALHQAGIKAPVYTTVQWDRYTAEHHPEWLIRKQDGMHEGSAFTDSGFDQSLCVNTGYYDFLVNHIRELCNLLGDQLDGLFFDMVGIRPCWCAQCRKEMKALGIDMADEREVRRFAKYTMDRFKKKMTALVRIHHKNCTIFYNAGHIGPCTRESEACYTHFELESLPSGQWGYLHFPVTARYARTRGKEALGMTGKFHTEWGDFHSLKNKEALEFECLRMLSHGFGCSIGDQLEPCGVLNPAVYRLIGGVYSIVRRFEPWARPSVPAAEAALVTSEDLLHELLVPESVMGAVQMLEELALQFDIISPDDDFTSYRLLILPDDLSVSAKQSAELDRYLAQGGKIISCAQGGLDQHGYYPTGFGTQHFGQSECYPDFLVPDGAMARGLEPGNEYVIYLRGESILPKQGAETVLSARAPYFKRKGERFCSHLYTPSAKGPLYPAAVMTENTLVFSHPLFTQYRENAPRWCKQLISNAIRLLHGPCMVRHTGPSTMQVNLLHQPDKNRYSAMVLTYVPVRKSKTIDLVEDRNPVCEAAFAFHLPEEIKQVILQPEGLKLTSKNGWYTVPRIDGCAVLELQYEAKSKGRPQDAE